MTPRLPIAALVALTLAAAGISTAHADDCRAVPVRGSSSIAAAPDENIDCKINGRILCALAEDRAAGLSQEKAIERVAAWANGLRNTGAQFTGDYKVGAVSAAPYVYRHYKLLPWSAYKYGVYTCGLNQRIKDSANRKQVSDLWEMSTRICIAASPGEGDGSGNEKLKGCLASAMDTVVTQTQPAPKPAK